MFGFAAASTGYLYNNSTSAEAESITNEVPTLAAQRPYKDRVVTKLDKSTHLSPDENGIKQAIFIFYDSRNPLHNEFISETN